MDRRVQIFKTISKRIIIASSIFVLVFSYTLTAYAAVPTFINYQGRLRDSSSNAVTSATTIQFSIYSDSSSGSPSDTASSAGPLLWTETYDQASGSCVQINPDSEGYFTVELSSCTSFPSYLDFTNSGIYVGVKIGSDSEATPRAELGTTPFAFTADHVSGAGQSSIGTTTPVSGAVATIEATTTSAVALAIRGFTSQTADLFRIIKNTGTELLTFTAGGSLGIGTSSPSALFSITNTSSGFTAYIEDKANDTSPFIIDTSGNVGIGTTSPYAKLSVVGETVAEYFTATSTTATSTFPYLSVSINSNLGTVVGGTWQGSTLGVAYGGTGTTSPSQFLYGDGGGNLISTSTIAQNFIDSALARTTNVLTLSSWFATTTQALISSLPALSITESQVSNLNHFNGGDFYTYFNATTTDALSEGSTNLYFTNARADARINATSTIDTLTSLTNLATVGTITSGTWQGTAIGDANVADNITLTNLTQITNRAISDTSGILAVSRGGTGLTTYTNGDILYASGTGTLTGTSTANLKTTLALNNVENTKLSTWAGTSNITTLGTITSGTWQGTAIGDSYLTKTGDWTGTLDSQEGSYYLNAGNLTNFGSPFYTYFSATTTDALSEGSTNWYSTQSRWNSFWNASTTLSSVTTLANLATVGALDSGSITSNFGTINTGASNITTTGTISGGNIEGDMYYDAIVATDGSGKYTTVNAATAGESAGASIFIKNGTYVEGAIIIMKSGQKLVGESREGVILDMSGGYYLRAWGSSGAHLTGILLDSFSLTGTNNDTKQLYWYYVDNSIIRNVKSYGTASVRPFAIYIQNSQYNLLDGVIGDYGHANFFFKYSDYNKVVNSFSFNAEFENYNLQYSTYNALVGNLAKGGGVGIYMRYASDDNTFTNMTFNGMSNVFALYNSPNRTIITGVVAVNTTGQAIGEWLGTSQDLSLSNSYLEGNAVISGDGFHISNTTVVGTLTIDSTADKTTIANSAFTSITDNGTNTKIINTSGTGITNSIGDMGNVGIGTTSPALKLQIADDVTTGAGLLEYGQLMLSGATNPNDRMVLGYDSTNNLGFINAGESGVAWRNLILQGNGGNVGINMTNPSVALDVTGDIEYTGTITDVSDERLKENITKLSSNLENILQLNPVSFNMIGDSRVQLGFTAQNAQLIFPNTVSVVDPENGYLGLDYVQLISPAIGAIQELNLNLESIADISASTTTASQSFASSFFQNLFARVTNWLGDTTNGIKGVFADVFYAKEKICVDNECLTKDDIRKLLELTNGQAVMVAPTVGNSVSSTTVTTPSTTTSTTTPPTTNSDTTPPIITITGNNPANIDVNSSYVDLGAIVTDNVNDNLGISYKVNGTTVSNINLDTSTDTTYTITYSATDQVGNTGTATRTVIVGTGVTATTTQSTTTTTATTTPDTTTSTATTTSTSTASTTTTGTATTTVTY